jgi:uncharacterized protein YycO
MRLAMIKMKPSLMQGDIVLTRGVSWKTDLLEKYTHSPYLHTAGLVDMDTAIEATGFKKTGYRPLDFYAGHGDILRCEQLSDSQRKQIVQYARSCVGEHYDYKLFFWEISRFILHKMLPYHKRNRVICSTLWVDAYQSAGITLCPGIEHPAPADLAESALLEVVGRI